MKENFTSGSVGRAPGNRCLYPEPDNLQAAQIAMLASSHFTAIRVAYKLRVNLALRRNRERDYRAAARNLSIRSRSDIIVVIHMRSCKNGKKS
jgi:hypothetical protein